MTVRMFSLLSVLVWCSLVALPARAQDQSESRKKFEAIFDDWKKVLEEMRLLKATASEAESDELPDLKKRYAEQVAIGEKLVPQLRDSAINVFKEAPGEDRSITLWLSSIARDYVAADRFQQARPAVEALLKAKSVAPEIYNLAGIIEFTDHKFTVAKEHFAKAAAAGSLTAQGQKMESVVEQYITLWKKEKELRDKADKLPDEEKLPRVRLETEVGTLVLEMFEDEAPETVANFISLVEKGFYDELNFHRVIGGFMAQGGCPEGTGRGGPGYSIYCECNSADYRSHFTGTLSMAHAGVDTGGSQFFVTFTPAPQLNRVHTAFGRVIEGLDVLAKIRRRDPEKSGDLAIAPTKIVKAEVIHKRDHKYVPNKVK